MRILIRIRLHLSEHANVDANAHLIIILRPSQISLNRIDCGYLICPSTDFNYFPIPSPYSSISLSLYSLNFHQVINSESLICVRFAIDLNFICVSNTQISINVTRTYNVNECMRMGITIQRTHERWKEILTIGLIRIVCVCGNSSRQQAAAPKYHKVNAMVLI